MVAKSSVSASRINTNWFGISWILRKLFWNAKNAKKEKKVFIDYDSIKKEFNLED